ncbi:MAG: hypothetical protein EHM58_04910 [Ignavibacteriae bacterium]|nr:MAG: hypothetical protein EHM58_04910 [Ignavibacteriota bacterium]
MNKLIEKQNGSDKELDTIKNIYDGDPTDGRKPFEWKSRWSPEARKEMRFESIYLFFIFFSSIFFLFVAWQNWLGIWLSHTPQEFYSIRKYSFYASSGMLGGIVFGMKYFYRVVARGHWHQDRRPWRLMLPFIATAISVIVGAMLNAGMMIVTAQVPISAPSIISIGFLAGYFADEAVGKMYEIANVIFGRSTATKTENEK